MTDLSLHGLRIWMSGAIPTDNYSEKEQISEFVATVTQTILANGGCVVHGCHPSITEIIEKEAISHNNQTGNNTKEKIFYYVSKFFLEKYESEYPRWEKYATILETPAVNDASNPRDASLRIMRDYLCARSDVIIAIGGKTWDEFPTRAGVAAEIKIAIDNNLPCFVLGGFGGNAAKLKSIIIENHYRLKNGLDFEQNIKLANCSDPSECTSIIIEQLSRLPIAVTTKTSGTTFRILCLDGGGIKGTYTASFLNSLEEHFQCRIADHFDLIAGTSTGGIIAVALAAGIPASDIIKFYKEKGPIIFPTTRLIASLYYKIKHVFNAKHSIKELRSSLDSILKTTDSRSITLGDLKCRVVIPTFHPLSGKSFIFRTPHCEIGAMRKNTNIVDVAIATAAAPTFFGPATLINNQVASEYIDGGIWANTPSLVAIVEATKHLNVPINKIDILSIGTTEEAQTFSESRRGILSWAAHLVNLLLHAQQESTLQLTKYILGETRILRVNQHTPKGKYSLDNVREINNLASLGATDAENVELINQIKSRFLNGIKAQNFNGGSLKSEVQHPDDLG